MSRTLIGPYLVTTSPTMTMCRCGRPVLAADVHGLPRHLDTSALNDMGELQALIENRKTYELHGEMLIPRTSERIASGRPSDSPVLADHACKDVLIGHTDDAFMEKALRLVSRLLGAFPVMDPNAEPPF
jgi:hypothetical protein